MQFKDEVDPCADGGCVDVSVDAALDVREAATDAAARDVTYDVAHLCKDAYDGWYCGFNGGLNGTAPSPDDLVHCVDGAAMLEHCDAGCVPYPSGIPDMCNTCGNKEGYYCNDQLGAQAKGVNYLSLCNGGQMFPVKKCQNKCIEGPGDASCQ